MTRRSTKEQRSLVVVSQQSRRFKSFKKTSAVPPEMYLDAETSKDGKEITEMFNRYFHSNFTLSDYKRKETEAPVPVTEFHFEEDEIVAV